MFYANHLFHLVIGRRHGQSNGISWFNYEKTEAHFKRRLRENVPLFIFVCLDCFLRNVPYYTVLMRHSSMGALLGGRAPCHKWNVAPCSAVADVAVRKARSPLLVHKELLGRYFYCRENCVHFLSIRSRWSQEITLRLRFIELKCSIGKIVPQNLHFRSAFKTCSAAKTPQLCRIRRKNPIRTKEIE